MSAPTLHRGRAAVTVALREALEALDDRTRAAAGYHLGFSEADGTPCEGSGGKAIRPALALLSAELAGAPAEVALPGAVAVELVHNFSLLHDDVMDGDARRRHRPTVWALWGEPCAILTGDALLVRASQVLLESGSPHSVAAVRLLLDAGAELVRGQVQDLAFETADEVEVAQCLHMAAGKTGALLAASAAIGAVLAGAPQALATALHRYGHHLGLAFQLVDDLLGIWGDPAVTGKPVRSDLRSRKRSLPVSWALAQPGTAELARFYARTDAASEPELLRVAGCVEAAGGRAWAGAEAGRQLAAAETALERVGPLPAEPLSELVALGRFVVDRDT